MSLERTLFGHVDGRPVHRYVMGNRHGTSVAVLTLGANLQSVRTRGRGGSEEITLAYDEVAGYLDPGTPYFGATVGRVANRIAGGEFELDGVCCRLACNAGDVHLHGGEVGFDRRLWHAAAREGDGAARVVLRYRSPAGEEGYPGTLAAQVAYRLTDHDELVIDLQASTDAPTIVNLANHAYWNLAGAGSGGVAQHELQLHCPQVLEKDADSVPTGRILPVAGTPFDFTVPHAVGERIDAAGGYDHCFVIDGAPGHGAGAQQPAAARRLAGSLRLPADAAGDLRAVRPLRRYQLPRGQLDPRRTDPGPRQTGRAQNARAAQERHLALPAQARLPPSTLRSSESSSQRVDRR